MKKVAIASLCALAFVGSAHADGDAEAGAKVFAQCSACHTVGADAQNSVGPVLNGVVGRAAGTYPGYRYSSAMRRSGFTWDEATLQKYLKAPDRTLPGTKMAFPGISSDDDLDNLIAYLKQQTQE
ncbi:cytochrome c family protein [Steroidobacter sp. S1-65]|uniref:Cytochrome c family protein n=1 Tax=Steroidobacter gossypii TaxID=2805490 RepID=A0ABS1X080_9GAMM|nr:cytochrome c family protein [Steroidobacter gossypii]MBM0106640.1 cytochrome c family protein [Steroidobacter gossypii]